MAGKVARSDASPSRTSMHIASRIAAAVVGGYAFTWGFNTLGIALLSAGGMSFGDATNLAAMLGFVVLLTAFCWAFVVTSVTRAWAALAGGGALMTFAGWWLARLA